MSIVKASNALGLQDIREPFQKGISVRGGTCISLGSACSPTVQYSTFEHQMETLRHADLSGGPAKPTRVLPQVERHFMHKSIA